MRIIKFWQFLTVAAAELGAPVSIFHKVNFSLCPQKFRSFSGSPPGMACHQKCINSNYPRPHGGIVQRFSVPENYVPWSVQWNEYNPIKYNMEDLTSKPWADPEVGDASFDPKWNTLDGGVNRASHCGEYEIVDSCPQNPKGRTGILGRGCLGRWGPNHAADPIVTRWKRDESGTVMTSSSTGLPILQFVAIERKDSKEWAIPGGMVDPGEVISVTLRREFCEEALNGLCLSKSEREAVEKKLEEFFKNGKEIYRGYVDDPRNTDNAWMETVVYNFHDGTGDIVGQLSLQAGDDAGKVQWMDISKNIKLYASHEHFVKSVAEGLGASW